MKSQFFILQSLKINVIIVLSFFFFLIHSCSDTNKKSKSNKEFNRIGAICNDGSESKAIGRGACSHHGGVKRWLYKSKDD